MKVNFDSDGQPLCPDCDFSLDCEPSRGREIETMGGYSISYFRCSECHENFELIDSGNNEKSICPS